MSQTKRRRWVFTVVKVAIVVALLWGVHRTFSKAWDELQHHAWSLDLLRWPWLAASVVFYIAALVVWCWYWWRALHCLGQTPGWWQTFRAYWIGHLGKYVPGKALVVVIRAALVRGPTSKANVAAASVFLETLTMMAVGACCAGVLLAVSIHDVPGWMKLMAILIALGAGVVTWPSNFAIIVARVTRGKVDPAALDRFASAPLGWTAANWGIESLGWLLHGISVWACAIATGWLEPTFGSQHLLLCTAAGALAVVVGFLTLMPGGALAREAVLLALLPLLFASDTQSKEFAESAALVTALLARVMSLAVELLISAILYPLAPRRD